MARTITRPRRYLSAKSCQRRRLIQPPPPPPPPPPAPVTTRVLRSQTKTITQATIAVTSSKATKTKLRRKRLDPWYPKRKPSKNPKPRAPPPTHFTCRICISHLPRDAFIRWVPPKCWRGKPLDVPMPCIPHLARSPYRRNIDPVCKTCISSTMAARFDTLGARRVGLGCLEPGCENVWPWEMVIRYFPVDKLEAYNLASFEHWCADTDLFTCLSPTCDFAGLLDPSAPGYPQVECPISTCKARSCAACRTPWHADQTCAEVSAAALTARMSDPEKETLTLMQSKDGKRCPNCQLVIEKDGGCPTMYCPGCKTYFNWDTAASAVPGTKKALPAVSGHGYWQMAGLVVCEVDGLEGKAGDDDVLARLYPTNVHGAFYNMDHGRFPNMPLPDEDDADL